MDFGVGIEWNAVRKSEEKEGIFYGK